MDYKDDLAIQNSRDKLLASIAGSPNLVFIRSWGNMGDELIFAGTRQLLAGLEYREVSIRDLQDVSGHTALISGGGGWCKPFNAMPSFLPVIEQRFNSVIVLPSTFDITEEKVRNALQKTKALVFAREIVSYRMIQGLCRSDIAHDCAFFFNFEIYKRKGHGILNAFRNDAESTGKSLPEGNIDISSTCSSLDDWLWTISKYAVIRTDRAHVMIAAAMLGKSVEYDTSSYHKVPAIAEYALKQYPVSRLSGNYLSKRSESYAEAISLVSRFAGFLSKRSGYSNVLVVDDLESHNFDEDHVRNDIIIIPNAILTLQRFPQLIVPLKKMLQKLWRVLLTDDIDSFPDTSTVESFLKTHDFSVECFGYVNVLNRKAATLAIISADNQPFPMRTPDDFRVIALISAYNEEDVIVPVIEQLHRDGVDVYLIDNWSMDQTYQKAESLLGKGLIGLERFPSNGPTSTYDWKDLLIRKEDLCQKLEADWFIHQDADEIRESPWEGITLRDAIYKVDQEGYNAIAFTVLEFFPIDNGYPPGSPLADYFRHCEFGKQEAYLTQIQAWKALNTRVVLNESGGHSADFTGRKVFPYNFLLRHYSIRSQRHGEKKVIQERLCRYNIAEKQQGWHDHYDMYTAESCFLRNPQALLEFDANFRSDYLIERLSGIDAIPIEMVRALNVRIKEQALAISAEMAKITKITDSNVWKIALLLRRIRLILAPPNSYLVRTLRWLKKAILKP